MNMSEENSSMEYELITQDVYRDMLIDLIEAEKKKINYRPL